MRMVDQSDWDLSDMHDRDRAWRLLNPPPAEDLIATIAREAMEHARHPQSFWECEPGKDMKDCSRAHAVVPLRPEMFDALFNGRSGYRAQYHLSEEEGREYNALLVGALIPAIQRIYDHRTGRPDWSELKHSLAGPWSKIWVFGDSGPFKDAADGDFLPRRWADRAARSVWIRAPLPADPALDVKGTWVSSLDHLYKQDPCKADRDHQIWLAGHA